MLSRIADSLFWLSRYMERTDGLLRSVRTHYILLLDKGGINTNLSWQPVIEVFTNAQPEKIQELNSNTNAALHYLLLDTTNYNALKILVAKARENARGMQDLITKEVWEHVNQMYHSINELGNSKTIDAYDALPILDKLTNNSILYNGVADTTMPRGLGWSFMNLGRYIERCLLTIEVCNKYFSLNNYSLTDDKDILYWRPTLLSLSGFELHLKTYRNSNTSKSVLHQALFNENFTRSILYTLKRIDKYFASVAGNNPSYQVQALSKQLGKLLSTYEYTEFEELQQENLPAFLTQTSSQLQAFSNNLAQQFFSYS